MLKETLDKTLQRPLMRKQWKFNQARIGNNEETLILGRKQKTLHKHEVHRHSPTNKDTLLQLKNIL